MLSSNIDNQPKKGFRQRHPVLFVFGVLFAAMALSTGAMALFSLSYYEDDGIGFHLPDSESIGVAYLDGTIESSGRMVAFLRKLREDSDVKGVLLRVNSGGGGFGPSQELYRAVKALAAKKPVVVSIGSVAASGGYYAACPAKVIYALPGSITGSIGVRSMYPNVREASEKLGFSFQNFTTGRLKDAGSPFREMTGEDKAYLQDLVNDLNDIFVGDVAQARNVSPAELKALQGKAMTAANALTLGLVDKMGSQEDAMEELKKLAGVTKKNPRLIRGPKRDQSRLEDFFGRMGAAFVQGMTSSEPASEIRAQ
ncbi:MAG: signal peptide peptidase SppA [Thermodesulfobacteriota bacterium]